MCKGNCKCVKGLVVYVCYGCGITDPCTLIQNSENCSEPFRCVRVDSKEKWERSDYLFGKKI